MARYNPGGIKDKVTCNVFVKNLPATAKSSQLYKHFRQFGPIFSCMVKYGPAGECKGYGYVRFETQDSADKAIAESNGKSFLGATIEVCAFKPRENRNSSVTMYNNLYVKNLPRHFANDDLAKLFRQFGEIVSAVVIKERADSAENKGFGFVCFSRNEDAKRAEEGLKEAQVEGQTLCICRALTQEAHKKQMKEDYKECNLYVKRFKDDVTDEALKKAFEEFGPVLSARVMTSRSVNPATGQQESKSLGFGFVCFGDKEGARRAIEAAATRPILGQMLYVVVAEKKEERVARYKHPRPYRYPPMYSAMPYFGPRPMVQFWLN